MSSVNLCVLAVGTIELLKAISNVQPLDPVWQNRADKLVMGASPTALRA